MKFVFSSFLYLCSFFSVYAQGFYQFGVNSGAKIIEADLYKVTDGGVFISRDGRAFNYSSNETLTGLEGRFVLEVSGDYAILSDSSLICFKGDCFGFPGIVENVNSV